MDFHDLMGRLKKAVGDFEERLLEEDGYDPHEDVDPEEIVDQLKDTLDDRVSSILSGEEGEAHSLFDEP